MNKKNHAKEKLDLLDLKSVSAGMKKNTPAPKILGWQQSAVWKMKERVAGLEDICEAELEDYISAEESS